MSTLLLTGEWPDSIEQIYSVIVDTLRREHSRNLDEMIPLIEALFTGPYLELFARTQRQGWTRSINFRANRRRVISRRLNRFFRLPQFPVLSIITT